MLPISEIRQCFLTTPHGLLATGDAISKLITSVKLLYFWELLACNR